MPVVEEVCEKSGCREGLARMKELSLLLRRRLPDAKDFDFDSVIEIFDHEISERAMAVRNRTVERQHELEAKVRMRDETNLSTR